MKRTVNAGRRAMCLALIALGAALVAFGPLLRFWVSEAVLLAPLDHYAVITAQSGSTTYFDPANGQVLVDQMVTRTTTLRGDVAAGTPQTVVYDAFTQLAAGNAALDADDDGVISTATERLAADRTTAELSPCCGASLDGRNVGHTGIQYQFPRHTERITYHYFDPITRSAAPAHFISALQISGMPALHDMPLYQFRQDIPETVVGTEEVSGALVGSDQPAVEAERAYRVTRDIFVEPRTGTIVRMVENTSLVVGEPGGAGTELVLVQGTWQWTPTTVTDAAERARSGIAREELYTVTYPAALLGTGVLVLVTGMVLFWRVDNHMGTFPRVRRREPAWV